MVVLDVGIARKRLRLERLIWVVDMAAYLYLAVSGVSAALDPSDYVVRVVESPAIIWVWGGLLMVGGVGGLAGRASRLWPVEYVGNVFAAWGAALYALILIPALTEGSSVAVMGLVLVAWGALVRRYAELKIHTLEPGLSGSGWRGRLEAAIRRRTRNTVPREHY